MSKRYCQFCDCDDDEGNKRTDLSHAQMLDGNWICDICYYYSICITAKEDPNPISPCREKDCKHRPVLMTSWSK